MTKAIDFNVTPLIKPYVGVVSVTPDTAERWLDQYNAGNRNLRTAIVNAYTRDMKADNWRLTAEPIKFGSDGRLLDGQHRLAAVVKSGVTVMLFVARGIDPEAQLVMDTGAKRTVGDALGLQGASDPILTAAAARLAILHHRGQVDSGKGALTTSEIKEFVDQHPEFAASVTAARKYAKNTDVPPAVIAYTHWVLTGISPAAATQFWVDASEKIGLAAGDPVIALTNRFAEARRSRERLPKSTMLSLIYRAWNLRRAHRTARLLRVNSASGGLVPIPEPR